MALVRRKKGVDEGGGGDGWLATYADMISLLLCFFVLLINPPVERDVILQAISEYFSSIGTGNSLSQGQVSSTANTIDDLPSQTKGKTLADALKRAVTLFNPEIRANKVKVTQDERGVVISFTSDMFFNPASATLNIEAARSVILNLAILLNSDDVGEKKFRIEGHTDSTPIDPNGPWESNWQLSTERALSVLYYLIDFGVSENRMQISGFGSTVPIGPNDTPEGRAYNRRVDIIIIDDAHL